MPHTIADVASEKGALLQRRGVDWRYEVEGETWSFRDAAGALSRLPLPQVPLPNAATAVAALRASGIAVDDAIARAESQGIHIGTGTRFGLEGAFDRYLRLPFTLPDEALRRAFSTLQPLWQSLAEQKENTRLRKII